MEKEKASDMRAESAAGRQVQSEGGKAWGEIETKRPGGRWK